MDTEQLQLPPGYEDAKLVAATSGKPRASQVKLPSGYEDAKPVSSSEAAPAKVHLPPGYEDAKPATSHLDKETQSAADRLQNNPIGRATISAGPSTWESLKNAV